MRAFASLHAPCSPAACTQPAADDSARLQWHRSVGRSSKGSTSGFSTRPRSTECTPKPHRRAGVRPPA